MNKTAGIASLALIAALAFAACSSAPKQTATEEIPKPSMTAAATDASLPSPDEFMEMDTVAEMIYQTLPNYPRECQMRGIQGTTWIKTLVTVEGKSVEPFVYKSSGSALLDASSVEAAKGCKFKPAMKDGKPVAMWVVFKYDFVMPK